MRGPFDRGIYQSHVAIAVPEHDVHQAFVDFADGMLEDTRVKPVFQRMAQRSGIGHTVLGVDAGQNSRDDRVCRECT